MSEETHHLAQFNYAQIKAELDDPSMHGFVSNLDYINQLADKSPGFVWRLKTEKGDSTDVRPYEDQRLLVTMSIWESLEELKGFVYRNQHAQMLRERDEYFEHLEGRYIVLWWVRAGEIPTLAEAMERMERLQRLGPTPDAFDFRTPFTCHGEAIPATPRRAPSTQAE